MKTALSLAEEKLGKNDAYVQAILRGGPWMLPWTRWWTGPSWAIRPSARSCWREAKPRSPHPRSMIEAARRMDPIARASYIRRRDTFSACLRRPANSSARRAS